MVRFGTSIAAGLLLLSAVPAAAQQPPPRAAVTVPTIPARPADVATIEGLLAAFYDVISGPAGTPRQWSRDRTLYIPDVRFVAMETGRDGKTEARITSHQQYVDATDAGMTRNGFFESELKHTILRFGNTAQVRSSYAMRRTPDGPVIGRGVNQLNLFWDGTRWWVASVMWDDERPGNPLPPELVP